MHFVQHNGYTASHPWYYKTGGDIVSPRVICMMASLRATSEFETMTSTEPVFSCQVEEAVDTVSSSVQIKKIVKATEYHRHLLFKRDIPHYRKAARNLRRFRQTGDDVTAPFDDVFSSIAFKHNHLFWHMRNLRILHLLKERRPQRDLFDF